MNIYIVSYSFTQFGTSGADVYHYNLALKLLEWGHTVRSVINQAKEPGNISGVETHPLSAHLLNVKWADLIITIPMLVSICKGAKRIIIVKHNIVPEPFDFSGHDILYCGEAVRQTLQMKCRKSFVLNPINRYKVNYECHLYEPDGPWVLINCNQNKGGALLIQLARLCPRVQFLGILGAYGSQIKEDLPNLLYKESRAEMRTVYGVVACVLSLSEKEGFPTVILEAMGLGVPVIGLNRAAGFVDVRGYGYNNINEIANVINGMTNERLWELSNESIARAKEIEDRRDYEGLRKFIEG